MHFKPSESKASSSSELTRVSRSQRRERSLSKQQTVLAFGAKAPSGNAIWLSLGSLHFEDESKWKEFRPVSQMNIISENNSLLHKTK